MDKNGLKSTEVKEKYTHNSSISGNIKQKQSPRPPDFKAFEKELEFFTKNKNQDRPGKIIHQSTQQSYDDQGNRVVKTKTVREIGIIDTRRSLPSKRSNNPSQKHYNESKYSKINEIDRQKALYSSPDYQNNSPYGSPIYNKDIKNKNFFKDAGYKTNYRYESKNIKENNNGAYSQREIYEYISKTGNRQRYDSSQQDSPDIEIVSPVGYGANYSSGSEFDEGQMRSLDNYRVSMKNENKSYGKRIKNFKNLNYEMEDPEGFDYLRNNELKERNQSRDLRETQNFNRSEKKNRMADDSYRSDHLDFKSPERNIDNTNKFRNVTVGMIDSKGPTNDDDKVTKIMTKKTENIIKEKRYKRKIGRSPKRTNLSEIEAARIIQAWWRNRDYPQEEVYDITVKKAIKLQSFIRGFLVRKKVLRYITLAIYYQSFCDKLQDVLCNNVKKELFKYFKKKYLGIKTEPETRPKPQREPKQNKNSPTNDDKGSNIIKKQIIITKFAKNPKNITKNRIVQKFNSSYTQSSRANNYPLTNSSPIYFPSPTNYNNRSQIMNRSLNFNEPMINRSYDAYYQNKNIDYYSSHNKNKSFNDAIYKREIRRNIRNIDYTTRENRYYNYNNYNRVRNFEKKDRNISPTFGNLRQTEIKRKIITANNSNNNLINRNRNIIKSNTEQQYTNINTTTRRTKKIITTNKQYVKKYEDKNIQKDIRRMPVKRYKNEIIPGGRISIIKLPNSRIKNTESQNIITQTKKKSTIIKENINNINRKSGFIQDNEIDNQLSIGIVKISKKDTDKDYEIRSKRVREEFVTYKEPKQPKIKEIIKEKIIIQKEAKPETAEEGNDTQIFRMKMCKTVAMSIDASTVTKEIIKNEEKELEIFKKREREKNKEIDKYKKDILKEKLKNKFDSLRHVIKITEYWKQRILKKNFDKFKNNSLFNREKLYKMESGIDFQLTHSPKKTEDISVQFETEKTEQGAQVLIKDEEDEKKIVKNFDNLKISQNRPVSIEKVIKKKKKVENKITSSKLKIISKIQKEDDGTQAESWKTEIAKEKNDINIIFIKPKKVESGAQYTKIQNEIGQTKQIEIIQNKPEVVNQGAQNEHIDNFINKELTIEIKGKKPECIESHTQYDKPETKITKSSPLNIKGIPKKEIIKKVETADAQCNTFNETEEKGINAVIKEEPKPKNIEVQIRTVKRSLHALEIPLLKKIWKRKAFRTFRENCKRPKYHEIIGRELLRMALLRWRFVNGYGPDRYGNVYDRDGNLLYKTEGRVADMEVQQEFKVEQEEQSTQYVPIENVISTLKQFQIGADYKKKIEPKKVDKSVGDSIKIAEAIQKGESITYKYKKKERPVNKISSNNYIEIKKKEKKLKDQGTEMPKVINKITKLEKISISNDEYKTRKKINLRTKELLIQMIYRKMMGDKLTLSEALRKWLKQTLLLLQNENIKLDRKKRRYTSISKAERFALIEEIKKMESGTQMEIKKNKIEKMPNLNVINKKKVKDSEASANIPFIFDIEKIKPQSQDNKIIYKSTKKPLILKAHKENDVSIYSEDYLIREKIEKGIHIPMSEESTTRVKEILIKFLLNRGPTNSALRKYFSIWYRSAKYLSCLDNAKIISQFCKKNLNKYQNFKKWRKITEKLIMKEKIKIIKSSKVVDKKRNKIFDLIRLTRINTVYAKRRYLHYILMCWLIYTRNINRKRNHIKALYENMLNTYMNMADDVFGNNQKENPSVQDALFEAIDSDKFHIKNTKDVPTAEKYYMNKKEIKKITTNVTYVDNDDKDFDTKEYITYQTFVSKHPIQASSIKENKGDVKITKKIIKVGAGERLQSRGRGRKYRTKNEREILSKFYSENRNYSKNKERLRKESEDFNNEKYINNDIGKKEVKKYGISIEKVDKKNRSFNKEEMDKIINKIRKDANKTEKIYKDKRQIYKRRFNDEDEKEIEDEI